SSGSPCQKAAHGRKPGEEQTLTLGPQVSACGDQRPENCQDPRHRPPSGSSEMCPYHPNHPPEAASHG
ncbi:hypothetical protein A2U01_0101638, partial [Trifolium medium]|nr:hypothetical protein [Trifolium medium]